MARTIKVEACDPELPPLLMISGMKSSQQDSLRDLILIPCHCCRGQHLA
jgi:hypothetical protein